MALLGTGASACQQQRSYLGRCVAIQKLADAQEAEALQADVATLGAQAAGLRRDLETKADMEAQFALRGAQQARLFWLLQCCSVSSWLAKNLLPNRLFS
jgi:hypothetical protein